jgi:hypothetical protein
MTGTLSVAPASNVSVRKLRLPTAAPPLNVIDATGEEHRVGPVLLSRAGHEAEQFLVAGRTDVPGAGGPVVDTELDEQIVTGLHVGEHGVPPRVEGGLTCGSVRAFHTAPGGGGVRHGRRHGERYAVPPPASYAQPRQAVWAPALRSGRCSALIDIQGIGAGAGGESALFMRL